MTEEELQAIGDRFKDCFAPYGISPPYVAVLIVAPIGGEIMGTFTLGPDEILEEKTFVALMLKHAWKMARGAPAYLRAFNAKVS